MATEGQKAKSRRAVKFTTRRVRRCWRCGRRYGYLRDFDLCRICFRELAHQGAVPGLRKSSW